MHSVLYIYFWALLSQPPPEFDILCFHLVPNTSYFLLRFLFWPLCYLSVLFNLHVFWYFPAIFLLFISNLIPWLCEADTVFYGPECVLSWWIFHGAWKEYVICCFWMKPSTDGHYLYLTNGPVEFNAILTDVLPAGSISFWQRQVQVSNCNNGFIYLSLVFYQFLPHLFWHSLVRYISIKGCYIFLEYWPFIII